MAEIECAIIVRRLDISPVTVPIRGPKAMHERQSGRKDVLVGAASTVARSAISPVTAQSQLGISLATIVDRRATSLKNAPTRGREIEYLPCQLSPFNKTGRHE